MKAEDEVKKYSDQIRKIFMEEAVHPIIIIEVTSEIMTIAAVASGLPEEDFGKLLEGLKKNYKVFEKILKETEEEWSK